MRIAAHGLAVDTPAGWDARIFRRRSEGLQAGAHGGRAPTDHPVLHVANFPLPEERGDFGSGAVELMRSPHVLVALLEYHQEAARTALFSPRGMPRRLDSGDFDPNALQRTLAGQAGAQRFFSEGGRAFCLYVVIGSFARRAPLVSEVNATLGRVEIG